MSDHKIRAAHRAWAASESPEDARDLLVLLLRAGRIEGLDYSERVWGPFWHVEFNGRKQANAETALASDGALALKSYNTVVAVLVPEYRRAGMAKCQTLIWSPEYANSNTSSRHVSRWHEELGYSIHREVVSTDEIDEEGPSSWPH